MYYSGNRWLTLTQMKVNATYIYEYLTARGWTKNAICGLLGNMQSESSINPAIWQGLNSSNPSGGFGLVQWTPSTKYTNWCIDNSLNYLLMESNLQRILWEVENHEQFAETYMTFQDFTQSEDTAYNLAMMFLHSYERPANPDQPWRGTQAEYWFNYLKGTKKPKHKSKIYLYCRKKEMFV